MATGAHSINDVVVPRVFTPYMQQMTERKVRLIQAGVLTRSTMLDGLLSGGGKTFDMPSWRALDNDADNVGTDSEADRIAATRAQAWPGTRGDSVPNKIQSSTEVAVRLERNNSWAAGDLAEELAGSDPMDAVADGISYYWQERLQAAFIATMQGVCKDNGGNDNGDYAHEVVGTAFVDGTTNFTSKAYLRAKLTMGDSMNDLAVVMVHSAIFNQMQENNLIDFIPDARGEVQIPTFMGAEVIMDDGMPSGTSVVRKNGNAGAAGMYETWLFGRGAAYLGVGMAPVPTEIERQPSAGNGMGSEVLHSRQVWAIHPRGHAYTGTAPDGGPGNNTGANNLNHAGSWNRVFPERKQIKFARLITREA